MIHNDSSNYKDNNDYYKDNKLSEEEESNSNYK